MDGSPTASDNHRNTQGRNKFLRAGVRPATPLICQFIDEHKATYGVVPICRALAVRGVQIAPRTYWAHRSGNYAAVCPQDDVSGAPHRRVERRHQPLQRAGEDVFELERNEQLRRPLRREPVIDTARCASC